MNPMQAQAAIEALLFASPEPLKSEDICAALGLDLTTVRLLIDDITHKFGRPDSGIMVSEIAGGHMFLTKPEYAGLIASVLRRPKPQPLSDAALETLAVIAYNQPSTRGEVERVRGVNSESAITTLIDRNLIEECGRKNSPGRPILYRTTAEFLTHLGLNSIDELPPLPSESTPSQSRD